MALQADELNMNGYTTSAHGDRIADVYDHSRDLLLEGGHHSMTEREKRTTHEGAETSPPARGVRLEWAEMPGRLRAKIEQWLGGEVVDAVTQPTGFSPGVAARLAVDDGRRFFVKAVGPEPNRDTPRMHRREARIMAAMPCAAPVPRLLWRYDEGEGGWIALVFEDVDGRHPTQPWRTEELDRVVAAMEALSRLLTPSPLAPTAAGTAGDMFATSVRGWRPLMDERTSRLGYLDEWSRRNLDRLVAIEDSVGELLDGDTLLNLDIRADNILITPERSWFVDWPHALVGPQWLDVVVFAPSVTMQGGPAPEEVISRHFACREADRDAITAAVVAIAGYFTYLAVQPPPPGLPTVRAFQDAQGVVAREWVARRTGLS